MIVERRIFGKTYSLVRLGYGGIWKKEIISLEFRRVRESMSYVNTLLHTLFSISI